MCKKGLCVVLLMFMSVVLSGCYIHRIVREYQDAMVDVEISQQAKNFGADVGAIAHSAGHVFPPTNPYADLIGLGVGSVASFFGGIVLARRKKKGA